MRIDGWLWRITSRNWMGWPTERQHRLTGRYQHILYNETGKWIDGRLPNEGGPNVESGR